MIAVKVDTLVRESLRCARDADAGLSRTLLLLADLLWGARAAASQSDARALEAMSNLARRSFGASAKIASRAEALRGLGQFLLENWYDLSSCVEPERSQVLATLLLRAVPGEIGRVAIREAGKRHWRRLSLARNMDERREWAANFVRRVQTEVERRS